MLKERKTIIQPTPETHIIEQKVLLDLRRKQAYVVEHETIASALKQDMVLQIYRETGVDINTGEWELDTDTGELKRG